MEYRILGRTGVRVSVVGLGCGGFGGIGSEVSLFGQGENQQQAFALMDRALELGMNYFDTADSYGGGRSEQMVGSWLQERRARDQIVLATKVFNPMASDVNGGGLSRRHILQAVNASLRRLQTDHIDLYMAHQVDPLTELEETMRAFEELVRAGKVLYLGFCNMEAWRVVKSLWISDRNGTTRLACIQNEYNLLHRDADVELLPMLASEGLSFVAFSPLAGGWLTGKYRMDRPPPHGSRMELRPEPYASLQNEKTFRAIERLEKVAAAYGASTGAVALAWAASNPNLTSILAAPRNTDQFKTVEESLALALHAEDRERIGRAMDEGHIENESISTA